MKVGILTYHWVANMGANLQALSTYKYLEKEGYEPIIINWIPSDVEQYYEKNVSKEQRNAHKNFGLKHFKSITSLCRNSKDVATQIVVNKIHLVCIGSDAVFSTKPFLSRFHFGRRGIVYVPPYSDAKIENPYWGDFISYIPDNYEISIVALSVSAQNSPYKKIIFRGERKKYLNALNRFTTITVRDVWTKNLCKYISKNTISPQITPDPVFAFNDNVCPVKLDYVKKALGISGDYVLLSVSSTINDLDWILNLEYLFEKNGLYLVGLPKTNAPFKEILKYNLKLPIDPLEWYDAIKYSKGYIGELMHPILVSLHNAIPIFAFDTYGYMNYLNFDVLSSKTYQILETFNLLDNYYNPLYNKRPSPDDVLKKILSTNTTKIKSIADKLLLQYRDTVDLLLTSTKKL